MASAGASDDENLSSNPSSSGSGSNGNGDDGAAGSAASAAAAGAGAASGSGSEAEAASNTPVADSMRRKLAAELQPLRLDIADNSEQHAGHGGYRGRAGYSGETHFTIEVVSQRFEGLTSIKRHRLVYGILDQEMRSPVHALSLITKTPAEAGMA